MRDYAGRGLLAGKRALVTGGDSGIARTVAVGFAKVGADVAITYLEEDAEARRTKELVEQEERIAIWIRNRSVPRRSPRSMARLRVVLVGAGRCRSTCGRRGHGPSAGSWLG
jgi:NAD(P)-dependent dehydrogenase (short-subunit alcohol dehydrogenase family)